MTLAKDSRFFTDDDLSVVIFFQRGGARQLRLTRRQRLAFGAAALGFIMTTSSAAIFGLHAWHQNTLLRQQLLAKSEGLFAYQVRYDDVFERTYDGFNEMTENSTIASPAIYPDLPSLLGKPDVIEQISEDPVLLELSH